MKKLLIASSLLLSGSVMASGFYAGGQLGAGSTNIKHTDDAMVKTDRGVEGMFYGAYIGYRYDFDEFFMAGELDYNFLTAKPEMTEPATSVKEELSQDGTMGFHILAGLPIGESTDIYGRIGIVQTKFKAEYKAPAPVGDQSTDKTQQGTVFGIGMQHHFDEMLTVRLDYRYTMYKKYKLSEDPSNSFNMHELEPSSQAFSVGLQYTFY